MPIYEYSCQACGQATEIMQKMSAAPAVDCPLCGKPALVKTISAAGFRLAGGGWYETDFKSGAKKNLVGDAAAVPSAAPATAAPAAAPAAAAAPASAPASAAAAPTASSTSS